jgi:phospholipid/cholesterol/gamma-HCH transport system permease protein
LDLQESIATTVERPVLALFEANGELSLLLSRTFAHLLTGRISVSETVRQMAAIGVNSLPIVILTITFSGMVLSLEGASQLHQLGGDQYVGGLVAISMAREAAPVLAAIAVAARVGSAIAAELGTMKVTEQVEALRALAVSPIYYLVVPRFLASVLMLPLLTVVANVAGFLGGWVVAVYGSHINSSVFWNSASQMLPARDLMLGLVKTLVFGAIIAIIGCDQGLRATGGAAGVGRATTGAVVWAVILVYVSDYFLSEAMYGSVG